MTWDTGSWGDSLWGGLVAESITSPGPHIFSDTHLTIDGHPVPMENDWQSDADAEGGYKRFSARVPLSSIRRFSLGQESQAVLYDDSGEVLWWGTLSQDPQIEGEIARIEAEGPAADAEKEAGRLLYQTRDYGLWTDEDDPPHQKAGHDSIEVEVAKSAIKFLLPNGESIVSGADHGVILWAPGTPGGITRISGTSNTKNGANIQGRIKRLQGPNGTLTEISTWSAASGTQTFGHTVASPQDAIWVGMEATSNLSPTTSRKRMRLVDLRVNGIWGNTGRAGTFSTMYADEGAADVFTRLGWGVDNTEINTNVLPQDHDGSYADLLSYLCELVDFMWLAPLVPGGSASFRPWGDQTWTVSDGGVFNLAKLRLYNKVVVPYESVAGAPLEATAVPAVDPLPGVTREYVHDALSDPQPDGVLAASVAQTLADLLGVPRWAGTVDVVKTREGSPYLIRPGDLLREENAGPGESRTHRVWSVTLSRSGVSVGIEDRVSVEGLVELAGLVKARRFRGRGRKKKRKGRR